MSLVWAACLPREFMERERMVAGRLRAVPRPPRGARAPRLDGLGRPPPRSDASRPRAAPGQRHGAEIRYYAWRPVGGRRAVAMRAPAPATDSVFGDFPFMVSAIVRTSGPAAGVPAGCPVGVPPEPSAKPARTGACPSAALGRHGGEQLRLVAAARHARSAALFDGFRLDHLVGLYRTFVREPTVAASRRRTSRAAALGDRCCGSSPTAARRPIAEDLGAVPDFVRPSLAPACRASRCCAGSAAGPNRAPVPRSL